MKRSAAAVIVALFVAASSASAFGETPKDAVLDEPSWRPSFAVAPSLLRETTPPSRKDPKVVVLMYHNLVFGRTGNEYNRDIYNFTQDLAFLRARFRIIDFEELLAAREGRLRLDSDAAVVSFDDGDLSLYGIAFPLLRECGVKATFFIVSGFVGQVGYLTWPQIREIASYRDGKGDRLFTIASHGANHKRMAELGDRELEAEFAESKAALEKGAGVPVRFFSLPFGSGAGDAAIAESARKAGYALIRTSAHGVADPLRFDPYLVPSVYVDNRKSDDVAARIWSLVGR